MRIQSICYNNNGRANKSKTVNPLKQQRFQASSPDMFIKSPSFGKHIDLLPFFEGNIKYTTENIEKFNTILKNTELSKDALDILIEVAKRFAYKVNHHFSMDYTHDFTFNRDFLFHRMNIDKIKADKNCERSLYYGLDKIKLTEEDYPKINKLLDSFISKSEDKKSTVSCFVGNTLSSENLPLLNFLFKNDCEYIKKYNFDENEFSKNIIYNALRQSYRSENPEIKERFSWKNLRHLVKDYSKLAMMSDYSLDPNIKIDIIETMPPNGARSRCVNKLISDLNSSYRRIPTDTFGRLPMSDYERTILANLNYYTGYADSAIQEVQNLMSKRIKNIVGNDGFETPTNILNCLKKPNMSEEMLTQNINGKTLIEEIAKTPLDENNQKIMQEIIEELSKYPHFKENEYYRKAGALAAKQGNAALLKLFNSRHIHYANNITEPVESYPKEVQEILTNAKIANEKIFEYADNPEALELFLRQNPKVDINTNNENGETLLMVAADKHDINMFSLLANREDVDLNIVDKFGENILMRILNKTYEPDANTIKTKEIEILRNLSPDRFDVNYVNYTAAHKYARYPYSALSKLVSNSFRESDVQGNLISELLKFPNIDTNFNPVSDEIPLALTTFEEHNSDTRFNIFKQMFLHPGTNVKPIISEKIVKDSGIKLEKKVLNFMEEGMAKRFFSEIKKLYDENGYFTLNEIEQLVNYNNFKELVSEKINIVGENIGHLLAEIRVDENNPQEMKQLRNIFRRLNACKYDFNSKDDFGVTPLAKSIECENAPLENMFRIYGDED